MIFYHNLAPTFENLAPTFENLDPTFENLDPTKIVIFYLLNIIKVYKTTILKILVGAKVDLVGAKSLNYLKINSFYNSLRKLWFLAPTAPTQPLP